MAFEAKALDRRVELGVKEKRQRVNARGVAADAMVEDTNYTMVTDLQIAEKAPAGVTVTTKDNTSLKQGSSGSKEQSSTATGNRHKYQTRIVSNANQVNLDFKDAKPVLEDQLANTLAGLF